MRVLKFGGTSVGSAQRMMEVANIIDDSHQKIVVLSAMSGTTNSLVEIANYLYKQNHDGANEVINNLEAKYEQEVIKLFKSEEYLKKGKQLIKSHFDFIKSFTIDMFTVFEEKAILAQGELISTALFHYFLKENGKDSTLLPALDYMRIDKNNEPDATYIKENLKKVIKEQGDSKIYITQGYICRNAFGEIDNLQRGGSDYSASLIGTATEADEIQIWTDIDGMHNNDPRYVENTKSISELSFDEAAELAYFGAKILHPTSVLPAKLANIPVRLLNTMKPEAEGTLISSKQRKERMAAVAAKDGITAIKIKSGRMLLAYGFLRKVFEIFESYKTPIDMITTSEVGVSVTIDDDKHLTEIVNDLKKYGTVEVDREQVIVCVVGDLIADNRGYANTIFDAVKEIPIRMISYGGSNYNLSLLINANDKKKALNLLSDKLFN
ncbi:aspartate kinase [Carboxylicivirga marina]|uniref:aspartate kinase n=1 Tax=Carboxylicivirga marina TaxID=2800988 RepID=UPI002596B1F1|nr:aspartate kinase [uncultured Carboxylicivirga sp.]